MSKRSVAQDQYIKTLEGWLNDEKTKRVTAERRLMTPKQGKRFLVLESLRSPNKKTPWAGRRQFDEEVTVQLNLQNL